MKSILGVSALMLLIASAYAAELPGASADGKRLHDANCMGKPRYWHLNPKGTTRSVFGRAEKAVGDCSDIAKERERGQAQLNRRSRLAAA